MTGYAPTSKKPQKVPLGKLPRGVDLDRLTSGIEQSHRRDLLRPREERYKAVQQMAGGHFSENGSQEPVPVNLIALYVSIMSSALVSQDPRFMLSTMDSKKRPAVKACEDWLNEEVKKQYLGDTLQRVVIDALFSVGILKVALSDPGHAAAHNWNLSAGQPFAERIDLDDFAYDPYAHSFAECTWIAHRYRVPMEVAEAMYRAEFDADFSPDYNPAGDYKINLVGRDTGRTEEFEDHVTLWEAWLPRHGIIVTMRDDPPEGENDGRSIKTVLRVQKWIGPECGPYHFLGFTWIPGSARPKGPIMDLYDLHRAVNRSYVKMMDDNDNWKRILVVPSSGDSDAKKFMNAANGQAITHDRPDDIKEIESRGVSNSVLQFAMHMKEVFSWLAGNLDIVGGLSPQSRTASQDKMLNENSSRMVGDKQQVVVKFTSKVGESLLWYDWNHPQKVMHAPISVPGLPNVSAVRSVYPARTMNRMGQKPPLVREGQVPDIQVDPYSLSHSTPQQRLAFLDSFVAKTAQMLPLWAQQGVVMNAREYVELNAKYGNAPDLEGLFGVQDPIPSRGGDAPGMPANTSREYIRRSLGGDSQQAKQNDLSQMVARGADRGGRLGDA